LREDPVCENRRRLVSAEHCGEQTSPVRLELFARPLQHIHSVAPARYRGNASWYFASAARDRAFLVENCRTPVARYPLEPRRRNSPFEANWVISRARSPPTFRPEPMRVSMILAAALLTCATSALAQALPYHIDPSAREIVPNLSAIPSIRFLTTADFPP